MTKKQISIQGKFNYKVQSWKDSNGVRLLLYAGLAMIFYFTLATDLIPKTYNITQGTVSEETIRSPKQIENEKATKKAEEEAVQSVKPVYTILSMNYYVVIEKIFNRVGQINSDEQMTVDEKTNIFRAVLPSIFSEYADNAVRSTSSGDHNETLLAEINKQLNEQQYRLPEETFYKLPRLKKDELDEMQPVTKEIVSRLMNDQIVDALTARTKVAEMVSSSSLTQKNSRELVQELIRFVITPNKFYDQVATDEAKAAAKESVKPIFINKNDVVVHKGEIISEETFRQLERLDLLKEKTNYMPQLGLAILVSLFVFMLFMFIRQSGLMIRQSNIQLFMLVIIISLEILGMKIFALGQQLEYPYIGFLAPAAMGTMLIALMLNSSLAFACSVLFGLFAGFIFKVEHAMLFDFRYGLVALTACFAAVFSIHHAGQRSTILKAGIMVSLFSALALVAIFLLGAHSGTQDVIKELGFSILFALAGGLLTVVFVLGLMPFFEVSFGILSSVKLVELSNPNHPLLRKLLAETPGTYHHSVMVGNLSESAAEAVGANGLLCRVGSFYHDIGKTKRPNYFIENQMGGENPHDRIEPSLSRSIITAHARDGVEMLKEFKMPKQIRDIAEQHHGTTLLKFFYHKARKQAEAAGEDAGQITEAEYRYPGPKAQSKEAAIVGISDCVEAAVRSLNKPTVEQIESMVRKIIKDRLDDQQFNECDLTLKDLDKISKSLQESVLGIFHSRIEYPDDLTVNTVNKGELV